jgi:hypothetical protein
VVGILVQGGGVGVGELGVKFEGRGGTERVGDVKREEDGEGRGDIVRKLGMGDGGDDWVDTTGSRV